MKVISLIPSWTETLIEAGVDVVGRTRFCIHPDEKIKKIPVVGGTKTIDWEKVKSLKADLLLLDKDENPLWMAEQAPLPYLATHIQTVEDVARDCAMLAKTLSSIHLSELAERWEKVAARPVIARPLAKLPAVEWVNPLKPDIEKFVYLIWKDPWMAVSRKTFIGSVLGKLGFGDSMSDFEESYPEIRLEDFDPQKTLLLFSTEPFPFGKKRDVVADSGFSSAIIDGEAYSWFGLRSLKFLEKNL